MEYRTFILFVVFFSLLSCGKKEVTIDGSVPVAETKPKVVGNQSLEGYQLILASDCLTCHKDDEKLVGPSYLEIAEKYSDKDIEYLADKIIEGGSGVWGEMSMTPHPSISKEDAKKMVAYILSIKR